MEIKWGMIAFAVVFGLMFVGLGLSEYYNHQCRIEAMRADYTKDAIKELCK